MSNAIDNDVLAQRVRLLEKELNGERGKRVALERNNAELARANERLQVEAAAALDDAGLVIQTAAGQLNGVIGFSVFLYAMGQYARAQLVAAVDAAQTLHREGTLVDGLSELMQAAEKYMTSPSDANRQTLSETHLKYRPMVKYHQDNAEELRAQIAQLASQAVRGRLDQVIDGLDAVIEGVDAADVVKGLNRRGIRADLVNGQIVIKAGV